MSNPPSEHAQCLRCRYPLKELAENVCPECGKQFDPEDSSTFHTHLPMGWFLEAMLRPVGVGAYAATAVAFATLLWVARVPGLEESWPLLISLVLWVLVLIRWGLHVCAVLVHSRRTMAHLRTALGRHPLSVTVVPVGLLLAVLIANTDLPMDIAFLASEKSLETLAQQAMQSPAWTSQTVDGWIGMYYVRGWTRTDEGVRIHIPASGGIVFGYDFAYYPNTRPVPITGNMYSHHKNAWYIRKYYGG